MSRGGKIDPNFVLQVAVGPPLASLVPQAPGSGLTLGGQFCYAETRFIWKKTQDDNRIFDATGRLMAVSYHYGKNPYESLDPLGNAIQSNPTGEWDSVCYIGGYNGMPDLKVRPKTLSLHGRQYIRDASGEITFCNVAKQSRLHSMSIRHNFAVFACEEEEKPVYTILVDITGRTMQVMNDRDERIALLQKSATPLLLNASLGTGSEFTVDVAPGVDWTAILAIVIGLHQVGKNIFKDGFNNFVVQPLRDEVTRFLEDAAAHVIEGHHGENDECGDGDGGSAACAVADAVAVGVAEAVVVAEEVGIVSTIIELIGELL
jgi:hypothetical protein